MGFRVCKNAVNITTFIDMMAWRMLLTQINLIMRISNQTFTKIHGRFKQTNDIDYALSISTNYNNMHTLVPPPETALKAKPTEYLTPSFKAYILEYILQSIIQKVTLPSFSTIKRTCKSQRIIKPHKNGSKRVKMRTQEQESSFDFNRSTYQYFSNSFHQLTPKHQSPFRLKDTTKNFKTEYHNNSYSIGLPLTYQEGVYGCVQRIAPGYFNQTDAQFVSPYRRKDNISIVQANYSTERYNKVQSPLSKGDSEQKFNAKDGKSIKMREKLKYCAARFMQTTLKYACNRLQISVYRTIQRISLDKIKKINVQKEEKTSRLLSELQKMQKKLKQQRKRVQKYTKDVLLYQKWSIFTKLQIIIKMSVKTFFERLKASQQNKAATIKQNADDEQQQYTIIYTNDEEMNEQQMQGGEGMRLSISAEWESSDKIEYSYRSRATNSSGQNQ